MSASQNGSGVIHPGEPDEGGQLLTAPAEPDSSKLLSCRGIDMAYGSVQILFGVDFDVAEGEIVALLGTNGAGKSTLLKGICGLVRPKRGSVVFAGEDVTKLQADVTAHRGISLMPGGKGVFPTLTVAENLRLAGWIIRQDQAKVDAAKKEVEELFPILKSRSGQMAGNLSGGEQQMLALGMAFIAKPKLLMIDELSLGLAPAIVEQLLGIVRRIQDGGTAIVLVEQSINVALTVADRAYFLEKGEVRFEGPTAELLGRDDIVRSVFLAGAAGEGPAPATTVESEAETHAHMLAGPARAADDRPIHERPEVLRVDGLGVSFGGIQAVRDTSFFLREGEILGLIGPNGAGKTTIFDLVSGFVIPTTGRIRLDDRDVTELGPDERAWLRLGRSFQDARLVGSLTVAENLALGFERHLEVRDHFAAMIGLPGARRQEIAVAWSVNDLVELMGLGAYRDKFVRELSTGTRRVVDLGMCLAHDPRVLLLDEPSSGIAQRETEALGPLLRRIQAETGCAILVIEHDMPLITTVSDRLLALELGTPIALGTPAEVLADPRVVESYLGGDPATINRSGAGSAAASRTRTAAGRPTPRRRVLTARPSKDGAE